MLELESGDLRVLLVEADADVREVLTEVLEGWGNRVRTANNADEALLALRGDPFDVLVVETKAWLARDGALRNATRRLDPRVAVVLAGDWAPDTPPPMDMPLVTKPFSPTSLIEAVGAALRLCRMDPSGGSRRSSR